MQNRLYLHPEPHQERATKPNFKRAVLNTEHGLKTNRDSSHAFGIFISTSVRIAGRTERGILGRRYPARRWQGRITQFLQRRLCRIPGMLTKRWFTVPLPFPVPVHVPVPVPGPFPFPALKSPTPSTPAAWMAKDETQRLQRGFQESGNAPLLVLPPRFYRARESDPRQNNPIAIREVE